MRIQQARDYLEKLNVFLPVRLKEIYPGMLKEMADVIAGPLASVENQDSCGKTYTCIQRRKKSNDSKLVSPSQTGKTSRSRP